EGQPDPTLRTSIDRVKKAIAQNAAAAAKEMETITGPKVEQGPDLGALASQLRKGTSAQKRQAAAEMGKIREAVPFLCYCLATEPDVDVRDTAVTSLGMLGGGEAKACLQKALLVQAIVDPNAPAKEMAAEAKEADLKRHIKAVLGH
ncbi:MAG TPA: HEAT repeat domain-containing protein, partial [Vicinamibacteria bacterium]|nr:HEAT repeat domain-containing protein [Vicinamibacteria bacterium]